MKNKLLLFLPLLAVVLLPSVSLAAGKVASKTITDPLKKSYAYIADAKLKKNSDSVTIENYTAMRKALTTVFTHVKLVEDVESTSDSIQPNSLLIFTTDRMIHAKDITRLRTELEKKGYKTISKSDGSILLKKGVQYITMISIVSDLEDSGRALVRVLVI